MKTRTEANARIRQAINEMDDHARSGQEALASEARRLLDTLCWSPDGYPEWVQLELRRRGLRASA